MFRETTVGRTKEEALSKLDEIMLNKHPDEIYSRDMAMVRELGSEKSEDNYLAEYISR